MQSTLGHTDNCVYDNMSCVLPDNGIMVWKGNITEKCIFKKAAIIKGELHGDYWMSNDHDMALSFTNENWRRTQVCPNSRPELLLIRRDRKSVV